MYIFDNIQSLNDNFVARNVHRLPIFRQKQCLKYKQELDKQNCLISYLLLMRGLFEQYGINEHVEFIYSENGKPYLISCPHIYFNLSHCKKGVVCAVADFEIGVDIQEIRPFNINIAQRVCNKTELRLLKDADNPAELFCRLWTEKESWVKATGNALFEIAKKDLPTVNFRQLFIGEYWISLYAEQEDIECHWMIMDGNDI
ncbi:MAG: 4'-phosphopantetheinyl transferase superfamily protein [Clostridiales bacterium]|nr:4'-phosphopantetheinyl transferase superfamily protein [Clostridiales bacterium]